MIQYAENMIKDYKICRKFIYRHKNDIFLENCVGKKCEKIHGGQIGLTGLLNRSPQNKFCQLDRSFDLVKAVFPNQKFMNTMSRIL